MSPLGSSVSHRAAALSAAVALLLAATACKSRPQASAAGDTAPLHPQQTAALLDRFHESAARADFDAYFACFSKDAVFLGTDATERWTVEQFKAYAKPHFDAGRGWVYIPRDRHVSYPQGTGGPIAYFDELLDHKKYGTLRGTGVLVAEGSPRQWKIAQYSLSFMVPNAKAAEVTAITRGK